MDRLAQTAGAHIAAAHIELVQAAMTAHPNCTSLTVTSKPHK